MFERRQTASAGSVGAPIRAIGQQVIELPAPTAPPSSVDMRSLVFAPFMPFVVDERLPHRQPAWVERCSLSSIWAFACRELMPDLLGDWSEPRTSELGGAELDRLVQTCRKEMFDALERREQSVGDDPHRRQRFVSRLGGEIAFADYADLRRIWAREAAIRRLLASLPSTTPIGEVANRLIVESAQEHLLASPADADLVAAMLANRFGTTSTCANIAVALSKSPSTIDIRKKGGAIFIDTALSICERHAVRFRAGHGETPRPDGAALIQRFHESVRGLLTIVDLATDDRWLRRLADIRKTFSDSVASEIDRLLPAMHKAFRFESNRSPAEDDAAAADYLAAVYGNAAAYRDSLAINELLGRVRPVAEQAVQFYADDLSRRLHGDTEERQAAHRIFEHFLGVAARVHGEAYAAYLRRSVPEFVG
jgi:hypothetical protein